MKRALLVGINAYPTSPLKGCVNDVKDMADFLVDHCGFNKSDIRLLVDERATTQNIIERLGWLLTGIRDGDKIVFHYSGHGAQLPTRNPQGEVDNLDEVICPVDFDWSDEHVIRDKDFAKMFAAIPQGVNFTWIADSCHSGDLEKDMKNPSLNIRIKCLIPPVDIAWRLETAKEKNIQPLGMNNAAHVFNGILIAACKADQTAADSSFSNRPNSALTYFLLQELQKQKLPLSLIDLVKNIFLDLQGKSYSQVTQLEGNEKLMAAPFLS